MTGKKPSTDRDWMDEDDAPDLSSPEFQAKFAKVPVRRGRPKSATQKISTTLRLDADVLERFRASGPGWQSRINETLRAAVLNKKQG